MRHAFNQTASLGHPTSGRIIAKFTDLPSTMIRFFVPLGMEGALAACAHGLVETLDA
jgi:hypothetical protein